MSSKARLRLEPASSSEKIAFPRLHCRSPPPIVRASFSGRIPTTVVIDSCSSSRRQPLFKPPPAVILPKTLSSNDDSRPSTDQILLLMVQCRLVDQHLQMPNLAPLSPTIITKHRVSAHTNRTSTVSTLLTPSSVLLWQDKEQRCTWYWLKKKKERKKLAQSFSTDSTQEGEIRLSLV